jgi:hydrogenase maturation protease
VTAALLIGIGNRLRGDDGIGPLIAESLSRRGIPDLEVRESRGEDIDFMDAWENRDPVFLIDAVRSGSPPGTWHVFDAARGPVPATLFGQSTHTFSVAQGIELARALGKIPSQLWLIGIEATEFGMGRDISPSLREKLPGLVDRTESEVKRRIKDA